MVLVASTTGSSYVGNLMKRRRLLLFGAQRKFKMHESQLVDIISMIHLEKGSIAL